MLASATRRIPGSALPRCASPEALAFRTFTGRVDHVPEMHGVVLLESTLVPQFLAIFVDVGSFEEPFPHSAFMNGLVRSEEKESVRQG